MKSKTPPPGTLPAVQTRSKATRDALIRAGRKLCESKDFDELSVAEIAAAAGCSTGSFYTRFSDKDGFFRTLVSDVVERDKMRFDQAPEKPDDTVDQILAEAIGNIVAGYRKRRGLIRTAQRRSMLDPSFWEPYRQRAEDRTNRLVRRLKLITPHDKQFELRVRFACQMLYGTLNNALLIAPGPLKLDDASLELELLRVFRKSIID